MNEFENFDPTTFEELTSLKEESEAEQAHIPEITELDTSGGTLLDKPLTNPILKALLVVTLVTFVVAIPAIIGATLITSFNNRKPKSAPKLASNLLERNEQEEIEKLKTAMAQIEIEDESKKLAVEEKPEPTPKSDVKAEVPISKQPEPVAEKTPIPQPPATITPEPILPAPKPKPSITQEPSTPIYISPVPNPQPIEKVRIEKAPTSVKKATPPKTVKPAKNPNPVRPWQQVANYGFAMYTPSKTSKRPKQRTVQVAASFPVQKARSKVIKKTTNPEYSVRRVRLLYRLKTNSLAKSDFKTQKRLQIKTVSAMEAMQPINAEVAKGYGLFLNFRQLGEEVTGVLVGDPTAITFHHNNGFVFIRQIKPINFPAITRSADGGTQLVVLTNSQYGNKQYVFHLTPVNEKVSYSGIVLKPNKPQLIQPRENNNFTNTI